MAFGAQPHRSHRWRPIRYTHLLWTVAVVTSINLRKDPELEWALSTACVMAPLDTESPDDKCQDGRIGLQAMVP
jgi:hypothetical protein